MDCIIHSIVREEYITNSKFERCKENSNKIAFLESFGSIDLLIGDKPNVLHKDITFIGKMPQVKVHSEPVKIRAIFFEVNENFQRYNKGNFLINKNDLEFYKSIHRVKRIFSCKKLSLEIVQETTLNLSKILVSLEQQNKNCNQAKVPHGKIDSRLIIINRLLRMQYYKPLTLTYLAEVIGCNPVYLCNTYSKVFHVSPMKHLQVIRMEKAKNLLMQTNFSVQQVSESVGFISTSQFSTYFKRYTGLTPGAYRLEFKLQENLIGMVQDPLG
ncbi:hypothetical protein C8Z91_34755 [Paenibacillus elgii]|uniref:HTH araC/xylS-type domain-containing protein n=1 Tax=Paenibacillus elgii TaxID=189691 RepID=A0A2T6FRU4_9BACL|nr:helix-turn-helix transcriptional regulator [Paenibacillus elgii]PUA34628.1 hypothetical protein C8Z91_34755 [Paenibacillus elgii]